MNFWSGSETCPQVEWNGQTEYSYFDDVSQILFVPEHCSAASDKKSNLPPRVFLEEIEANGLHDLRGVGAVHDHEMEGTPEVWARYRRLKYNANHTHAELLKWQALAGTGATGDDKSGVGSVWYDLEKFPVVQMDQVRHMAKVLEAPSAGQGDEKDPTLSPHIGKWMKPQRYPTTAARQEALASLSRYLDRYAKARPGHGLRALPLLGSFVTVHCSQFDFEVHSHPWHLVFSGGDGSNKKNSGLEATPAPAPQRLERDAAQTTESAPNKSKSRRVVSVLLLLFDGIGRQGFRREFPLTSDWLIQRAIQTSATHGQGTRHREKTKQQQPALQRDGEEGEAETWVEFPGMTTIGPATYTNMNPMLHGWDTARDPEAHRTTDLIKTMIFNQAKAYSGGDIATGLYTGQCIHIQASAQEVHQTDEFFTKDTKAPGDDPALPSGGFGQKNAFIDDDNWGSMCHGDYGPYHDFLHGPYSLQKRCLGKRYVHQVILNHTLTTMRRHLSRNKKFFHMNIFMEGHEGSKTVSTLMDSDLRGFLMSLDRLGFFQKAALMIVSDHGPHTGLMCDETRNGAYERTTPTTVLSLPPGVFAESQSPGGFPPVNPKDLRENSEKFLTPFDTYATLRDLLTGVHTPDSKELRWTKGKSYLRHIPSLRNNCTAANANEPRWCSLAFCGGNVATESTLSQIFDTSYRRL